MIENDAHNKQQPKKKEQPYEMNQHLDVSNMKPHTIPHTHTYTTCNHVCGIFMLNQ